MNDNKEIDIESWSAQEWEEYLSELEAPLIEKLLDDPTSIECLSTERHKEGFSALIGQNYTPHLKGLYAAVIDALTPLQQKVITDVYWNNRTLGEISKELKVSRPSVFRTKLRAEAQIRSRLDKFQKNINRMLGEEAKKVIKSLESEPTEEVKNYFTDEEVMKCAL